MTWYSCHSPAGKCLIGPTEPTIHFSLFGSITTRVPACARMRRPRSSVQRSYSLRKAYPVRQIREPGILAQSVNPRVYLEIKHWFRSLGVVSPQPFERAILLAE